MATSTPIRPFRYSTRALDWAATESAPARRRASATPTMYLFIVHPFLLQDPSTGPAGGEPGSEKAPDPISFKAPCVPSACSRLLTPVLPSSCGGWSTGRNQVETLENARKVSPLEDTILGGSVGAGAWSGGVGTRSLGPGSGDAPESSSRSRRISSPRPLGSAPKLGCSPSSSPGFR